MIIYIFIISVFLMYGFTSLIDRVYVEDVEAGPTNIKDSRYFHNKSYHTTISNYKDVNGNQMDMKNMFIVRVDGNCLVPRNIKDGNELVAEKYDNQQLNKGDILVIYLKDKGFSKLRIIDSIEADVVNTYNYDDNGEKHMSSRPHRKTDIKGIIRYKML